MQEFKQTNVYIGVEQLEAAAQGCEHAIKKMFRQRDHDGLP